MGAVHSVTQDIEVDTGTCINSLYLLAQAASGKIYISGVSLKKTCVENGGSFASQRSLVEGQISCWSGKC